MRNLRGIAAGFALALAGVCAAAPAVRAAGDAPAHPGSDSSVATASSSSSSGASTASAQPVIVIGLVGGWIRPDNQDDHIVQLAGALNRDYGPAVRAEIFENHHRDLARERIFKLLDRNGNGTLEPQEKQNARIVLYGESWGACETVALARELEQQGIPVLLTVQVDSIAKPGKDDSLAPPNVAQAVNFYQPHGIVHGRQEIRAEDASRTQVLGNFRFDYANHPVAIQGASWFARTFARPHVSIENDPAVWSRIEKLIRSKLPAPAGQQTVASATNPQ
jgi:hypothetical protein